MSAITETGRALAERGYAVHPIGSDVKYPKGLEGWERRTPPTPDEAAAELEGRERLGVRTGAGLLVMDVDRHDGKDGFAAFAELAASIDWTPPPYTAETGGDGAHLWLRIDCELPNGTGLVPGVDWRADGGQVVVPPSSHESGKAYRWTDGLPPALSDLPPAPAGLVEAIRDHAWTKGGKGQGTPLPPRGASPPVQHSEGLREWGLGRDRGAETGINRALDRLASIGEGARNDHLNKAAWNIGGYAKTGRADAGALHRALAEVGLAIGLDPKEIDPTIESGMGKAEPKHSEAQAFYGTDDSEAWRDPIKGGMDGGSSEIARRARRLTPAERTALDHDELDAARYAEPCSDCGQHSWHTPACRAERCGECGVIGRHLGGCPKASAPVDAPVGPVSAQEAADPPAEPPSWGRACWRCGADVGAWAEEVRELFGASAGRFACADCREELPPLEPAPRMEPPPVEHHESLAACAECGAPALTDWYGRPLCEPHWHDAVDDALPEPQRPPPSFAFDEESACCGCGSVIAAGKAMVLSDGGYALMCRDCAKSGAVPAAAPTAPAEPAAEAAPGAPAKWWELMPPLPKTGSPRHRNGLTECCGVPVWRGFHLKECPS